MCIALTTIGENAQNIDKGTIYLSLGNAYPTSQQGLFHHSNGLTMGNEWVTGITHDGDDDDNNGNFFLGEDEKINMSKFNLAGQFGFFPVNGLLTGIGLEYGSYSYSDYDEYDADNDGRNDEILQKNQVSSLAISPFVKYYIKLGSNALVFSSSYTVGRINAVYEYEYDYTSNPTISEDEVAEPIFISRIDLGAGMAFFLTENISLEPSLNFAMNSYTQEQEIYNGWNWEQDPSIPVYEDKDVRTTTNAVYLRLIASMYF